MGEILKRKAEAMRKSAMSFFVRNDHLTLLLIMGVLMGGLYSIRQMPIESEPEVKIPIGIVVTAYPGASPSDVEKLVTDELEHSLEDLDDVKRITSDSREGLSVITVEFEADADLEDSIRNLRDEVDTAQSDLPEEALDSSVEQIRAEDRAIITFTLTGKVPFADFKKYSDELQDLLEDVKGVNKVEIRGLPDREMQILVDIRKLEGYGLSLMNISRAIGANHIDVPVGSLQTDGYYYQTSLKGQFDTPEELNNLVIATLNGQNIFLRDIAEVREVFAETSSETQLFEVKDGTYSQAIALGVYKKVGEDLVRMVNEAKTAVRGYEEDVLPDDMHVIITDDESDRIKEDISNLLRSAWQTIVIIGITLLLALGVKEAALASTSIPILYLIASIGLALVGETFNFLTFFALILSLGVVVDTSIVVLEGIHENMNKHDMDAETASLASMAIFKAPLSSGSLTTIAAFVPLGLMTGIMGEYVKHIPITVNLTLLASLFTALMILPAIAKKVLHRSEHTVLKPPFLARFFEPLSKWYARNIERILSSKRERRAWLASLVLLFFLSGGLLATGIVKFKLFSSVDTNLFFVNITAPEGSSLERTRAIANKVEKAVEQLPELKRFVSVYGNGGSHKAQISITLTDPGDRDIKSYELTKMLHDSLRPITEAEILIEELEAGPPSGADIQVRLLGDDVRVLEEYAATVQGYLGAIKGATNVTNDLELSPGEFHIKPKRDRLEYFGVSTSDIGGMLRTAVFGDDSVKINRNGEETPIVVRLDFRSDSCLNDSLTKLTEVKDGVTLCRTNPKDISQLLGLLIPTKRGLVPLGEMVDIELTSAVTTIRHFDSDRVVNVKADVEEGYVLNDVLGTLMQRINAEGSPHGIRVEVGGENEDTAESMASLARAGILAMLLIFVILVYQFGSFRQVFIVLTTMPLAVMGVLYGLAIIRLPLSFPGMIGLVALLGIVVNDAIVLIDKINVNREAGLPLREAVEKGCEQRLEPVIITTLTTALGVLPLIFTGETFRDLAIVVAVGITIATVFTLIVVPILYMALESPRKGNRLKKTWMRIRGRTMLAEPDIHSLDSHA